MRAASTARKTRIARGKEGKFYLWTLTEIQEALSPQEADLAVKLFGVTAEGNYPEAVRGRTGKNILHFAVPIETLAQEQNLTLDQFIGKLAKIVNALFKARELRVHPAKDDKVLVDWNGLMIAALAKASQVLEEPRYLQAAIKAADFILKEMRTPQGRLLHRYAKGETAVGGFLDDYACLVFGLIEVYEASLDEKYLQASVELTKVMVEDFWDDTAGGFFFSTKSTEQTLPRIKQTYDGAVPSGNSIALVCLLRLAALSGETSFGSYGDKLLAFLSQDVLGQPLGHTFALVGLDLAVGPSVNVVLVGDPQENDVKGMLAALRKNYLLNLTMTLWTEQKAKTAPLGVSYERLEGKATAYVCVGQTCLPPTNSVEKMLELVATA